MEIGYAALLEVKHSKQEILLHYAANAPYGGNVIGIKRPLGVILVCTRINSRGRKQRPWPSYPMRHPLSFRKNQNKLKNKRDALLLKLHQNKKPIF